MQGGTMRSTLWASLLATTFIIPAFAQQNAPKKGSDADEAFMTGIRKIGVMSGQAFACSSETDQPKVGQATIDLATQVSLHFGLQAAFIYSGSKLPTTKDPGSTSRRTFRACGGGSSLLARSS
jgi:hypothetical protein